MQTKIKFVVGASCSLLYAKRLTTLQKNKFTPTTDAPMIDDFYITFDIVKNTFCIPFHLEILIII